MMSRRLRQQKENLLDWFVDASSSRTTRTLWRSCHEFVELGTLNSNTRLHLGFSFTPRPTHKLNVSSVSLRNRRLHVPFLAQNPLTDWSRSWTKLLGTVTRVTWWPLRRLLLAGRSLVLLDAFRTSTSLKKGEILC